MDTKKAPATCSEESCDFSYYAKGFCKNHYNADLKRRKRGQKECAYKTCDRMTYSRFCSSHYRRRKNGAMDAPIQHYEYSAGCSERGCEEKHYARGMCRKHYRSPGADDAEMRRDWNLRVKYGIGVEERGFILALQGECCAICGELEGERPFGVDHDHAHCGGPARGCRHCVRGVLCNLCNTRLSALEDPGWMERANAYLNDPPAYKLIERPKPGQRPGRPFADAEELLHELGIKNTGPLFRGRAPK